jgi:hypothetical protein
MSRLLLLSDRLLSAKSGQPAVHEKLGTLINEILRGRLKTAAKTLVAVFLSFAAAFVWWAWLPEPPPLPHRFLLMFEPIVMFVVGQNVHGAEELLGFLEIWCYVVALLLLIFFGFLAIRRRFGASGVQSLS